MRRATLPAVAGDMLESLAAHRMLTASQLRTLHAPHASARWTRDVLARLVDHDLVGYVRAGRGARRIYHLTDAGHHATGRRPARQRTVATALSAHTLAVNDVGLAFVQAARQRGDEFGPLAWRHEIAHPIGTTPGRRTELVIADAVLSYLEHLSPDELVFHYRFLELDRATQPTSALAAKLARYARLSTYTTKNDKEPLWHRSYPVFPEVLVVLTNAPAAALHRRRQVVLALCRADPLLQRTPQVAISITTLQQLLAEGPWAPIFRSPSPDGPVNWIGEPA